jgi:hypothetical protein
MREDMFKIIGKSFVLLSFLCMGNALADGDESPLADLKKGTLIIPCVYVELEEGGDKVSVHLEMHERGNSMNWEIVAGKLAGVTDCSGFVEPVSTEEDLAGDSSTEAEECVSKNANNCHDKDDDEDEDEDEDEVEIEHLTNYSNESIKTSKNYLLS